MSEQVISGLQARLNSLRTTISVLHGALKVSKEIIKSKDSRINHLNEIISDYRTSSMEMKLDIHSLEQQVAALSRNKIVDEPDVSEQLQIWHPQAKSWVKLVGITCMHCKQLVDISDPTEYYLERRNGDSFYGYEANHVLCAEKISFYGE